MSPLLSALLVALTVLASGIFSGAETGFYSISRTRVAAGTAFGHGLRARLARLARALLRDEVGLLITLLVANNLVNQAATYAGRGLIEPLGVPLGAREVVLTLFLTPLLFLFGELFPKDLFRRRPHAMVAFTAPIVWSAKLLLFPIAATLGGLSRLIERSLGLDSRALARVRGREDAVLELMRERGDDRADQVEGMARNVLGLRALRIDRAMIPWRKVLTLSLDPPAGRPGAFEAVARAPYSRLPVVDGSGAVRGYVHQIEVLSAGPALALGEHLRPVIFLEATMPIDRALARMRSSGLRMAAVGSPERPLGIVTVKDLVEEISGELTRW